MQVIVMKDNVLLTTTDADQYSASVSYLNNDETVFLVQDAPFIQNKDW